MVLTGIGKVAGTRSGTKNQNVWMNLFLDDVSNPMDRLQVYVPKELQKDVSAIPVGSEVSVELNMYMRTPEKGFSQIAGSLSSIHFNDLG